MHKRSEFPAVLGLRDQDETVSLLESLRKDEDFREKKLKALGGDVPASAKFPEGDLLEEYDARRRRLISIDYRIEKIEEERVEAFNCRMDEREKTRVEQTATAPRNATEAALAEKQEKDSDREDDENDSKEEKEEQGSNDSDERKEKQSGNQDKSDEQESDDQDEETNDRTATEEVRLALDPNFKPKASGPNLTATQQALNSINSTTGKENAK